MRYTGVDEVGYGALAGPIVAVAVSMQVGLPAERIHRFWPLKDVKDSKKTTAAQRSKLSPVLVDYLINAEAEVGIASIPAETINRVGYSKAADLARTVAVERAVVVPGLNRGTIIIDGNIPLSVNYGRQVCVPKADAKYWLVAAASILAKEYRDRLMVRAAIEEYPGYGWEKNKGYAGGPAQTSAHVAGLVKLGMTPMHRTQPCTTMLRKVSKRS